MARLLLVEDNRDLALGLVRNLELEGHVVRHVLSAEAAIESFEAIAPELVVLDMMLPGQDGFAFIEWLRGCRSEVPVLCLTARGEEVDKVRALRTGADDYLTKPFGLMELLARIEALLRRSQTSADQRRLGTLAIDLERRLVTRDGATVALAPKEFDLLAALVRAGGRVLSRQELLQEVWGHAGVAVTRTVDTHVAELRRKLESDPAHPELIITVRKAGYRLIAP